MDLITLVQGCAMVFTFGFFFSGSAAVLKVHQQKSVKNVNFLPYLAATLNCCLWTIYGHLKGDWLLILVNAVGCILQAIYIFIFMQNCDNKPYYLKKVFVLLTTCLGALSFAYLGTDLFDVVRSLGLFASTVTVLMFGSPLSVLRVVIATKSSEQISFPLSLMTVCNCFSWLVYGYLIKDSYVQVPNFFGLVLGIIQVLTIYQYPNKTSRVGLTSQV
ncbi:sugar transporter SWEET1-like [Clytia hemisphaerica]|uniref:Sugar transporter SWEET1 n=1 Tax=Clytia hemisphaerica TaxID=252671 RepID=A0A7M6DPM2_9CNID|eukprot:TCONS_00003795-protein